jgi:hypothetical protein
MKVRITGAAAQDLLDGHAFYERHQQGIGDYFLDSLYADLMPCSSMPASIPKCMADCTGRSRNAFPLLSITT